MKTIVVDIHGTPHEITKGVQPDGVFIVLAMWSGNRYSVLSSSDRDLFDPLNVSNNIRGGLFWKLRTCSQECYQQYTTFLRSKNRTPYILAQRRFRNDF